jgi:hypothetical protein
VSECRSGGALEGHALDLAFAPAALENAHHAQPLIVHLERPPQGGHTVQAGPGDTVLVMDEGTGARQILGLDPGAIRAVVVGIVDEVSVSG